MLLLKGKFSGPKSELIGFEGAAPASQEAIKVLKQHKKDK